ncbi:MAG: ATP-binding protein, partial [Anaerolineales bacterium]
MQNSSNVEPKQSATFGDPNCPICKGVGFIRQDLPIDHPDFGKLQICTCRHSQVNQIMQQRLFRLSNLDSFRHMTFETFNPQGLVNLGAEQTRTLEMALNQATQFARRLEGWLLLMGGYGCGKTHLAAAIANHAVSLGVPTL